MNLQYKHIFYYFEHPKSNPYSLSNSRFSHLNSDSLYDFSGIFPPFLISHKFIPSSCEEESKCSWV